MTFHKTLLSAGLVLLVSTSCDTRDELEPAPRLQLEPCRLKGYDQEISCARFEVFEDRKARTGRKILLNIAVIQAASGNPAPDPLFILAGGPGQAATSYVPWVRSVFKKVHFDRDIVLVDQRGTGKSNPLNCEWESETGSDLMFDSLSSERLRSCLSEWDADVRFYSNFEAMGDLDEIRRALGYEEINLWGGSYGTRAAQVYMRMQPDHVRTAILDGVAPFDLKFPLYVARDSQRALNLMFENCDADEDCRKAFPGLREKLDTLLDELERRPRKIEARHPRTGEKMELEIGRDAFVSGIRGFLYVPLHTSLIPFAVESASGGNFEPFVAMNFSLTRWSVETMSLGMTISVLCAEDLPRIDRTEVPGETRGTFVGAFMVDAWARTCDEWPRAELPRGYAERVSIQVPTLLLSGNLDPVTPPQWGEMARENMPRSLHLVVPGAAHNVSPVGCVPDLMATFLDRGTAEGLDASCVRANAASPFFVQPSYESTAAELAKPRPGGTDGTRPMGNLR